MNDLYNLNMFQLKEKCIEMGVFKSHRMTRKEMITTINKNYKRVRTNKINLIAEQCDEIHLAYLIYDYQDNDSMFRDNIINQFNHKHLVFKMGSNQLKYDSAIFRLLDQCGYMLNIRYHYGYYLNNGDFIYIENIPFIIKDRKYDIAEIEYIEL